jgi:hypothetical protein
MLRTKILAGTTWGRFLLAGSICGIQPVDVKVKMLKPREFCGRNSMQHARSPEKTGENHVP